MCAILSFSSPRCAIIAHLNVIYTKFRCVMIAQLNKILYVWACAHAIACHSRPGLINEINFPTFRNIKKQEVTQSYLLWLVTYVEYVKRQLTMTKNLQYCVTFVTHGYILNVTI